MAVQIDVDEQFPHLSHAPIVEAALDVRGRAQTPFDKDQLIAQLGTVLPDYPKVTAEHGVENRIDTKPNSGGKFEITSNVGILWQGLQCRSTSAPNVARFTRDFFAFSRLQPYENFDAFLTEAVRLLQIHQSLADIGTVQRLGLRFINRFEIQPNSRLKDYLTVPPREVSGLRLPFAGFYHNDIFVVPTTPYGGNLVRTMQVFPDATGQPPAIILDINIHTLEPMPFSTETITRRLREMRWLKNKLFFANLTHTLIERFK